MGFYGKSGKKYFDSGFFSSYAYHKAELNIFPRSSPFPLSPD